MVPGFKDGVYIQLHTELLFQILPKSILCLRAGLLTMSLLYLWILQM